MGIDLTCITTVFDGGKDQVIYNLLRGFQELGHERDLVIFCYHFLAERVRELLPRATLKVFRRLRGKKLLQDLPLRTVLLPYHARALRADVLLFPKYYTGLYPFSIPTVVIPHDIQFRAFPERFSRSLRLREHVLYGLDFLLRERIVAVSDFDAEEIRRFYPRSCEKVLRIYNPICFMPASEKSEPPPHPRRYVLSINISYPHKNTITLLRAFALLRDRIPHDLVLVGELRSWNRHLVDFVARQGLGDRVLFAGHVDEHRLRSLIRHADVYVNPSLYEGFGMTPIEAMGAGVPVVSTRKAALLETTRGLAEYYEPAEDPGALAATMLRTIESPPTRAIRLRNEEAMREAYDYRVVAGQYWELFRELVEQRRRRTRAGTRRRTLRG